MVKEFIDIVYDKELDLKLDLYLPESNPTGAVFIFFHGGGFEDYRQKDMGAPLSRELAAQGIACVNPAYRHYPNAHFPDYIEDGAKAVAWTIKNIQKYSPCNKVFIGGHSAGAYLSMLLCFDHHYLESHGINPMEDIAGYLFASGQPTTHFNILKERGIDSRAVVVDECSPLFHVREKGAPLLVMCTDKDIENRKEQTDLFVSTLKSFHYESSVEYLLVEGYGHNDYLFPDEEKPQTPSFASGIMKQFIEKYT